MELRLFEVNRDGEVELIDTEPPSAEWLTDGRIRWLDIQAAPDPLLVKLLAPLGVDASVLHRYTDAASACEFVERSSMVVFTHPLPLPWAEDVAFLHVICMGNLLISFHIANVRDFEGWYARWLSDWPLASRTVAAVLHRLMESLAEVDKASYFELRRRTSALADAINRLGSDFDDREIEIALTTVHRIDSFFFDQRLIYSSLLGVRSKAFDVGEERERFQLATVAAEDLRGGIGQLQNRIENLQQQHMLDVQSLTDRNLRVLTVLSAIFLPLTLISGIYGMNFVNMPELDDAYAYPTVLGIMGVIALLMTGFFYWRGWLR